MDTPEVKAAREASIILSRGTCRERVVVDGVNLYGEHVRMGVACVRRAGHDGEHDDLTPDFAIEDVAAHLRAVLAALDEATETIGYLRAGLDAMARTINPAAGCAPGCSSWSEDYRINDCDCGYVEAGDDGCAVFAVALLHGEPVLDGCFRDDDTAPRSAP